MTDSLGGIGMTRRGAALEDAELLKLLYYLRLSTSVQFLQTVRRDLENPLQMFV